MERFYTASGVPNVIISGITEISYVFCDMVSIHYRVRENKKFNALVLEQETFL